MATIANAPAASPASTDAVFTPELQAYYGDRRRMWRNIGFISICNLGWSLGPQLFAPLQQLALYDRGWTESRQGIFSLVNGWLVAFLVMYFSWMSDHTVTRFGRRKRYLMLSAPFIIVPNLLFPAFDHLFTLVVFMIVATLFSDLKGSTFPLISIDCVPRSQLGRTGAILGIVGGLLGFICQFWGIVELHRLGTWVPFIVGGALMCVTTLCALGIREPPIYHPSATPFRPWSALVIGLRQPRNLILFAGCGAINSFPIVYSAWAFLFATRALHLDWDQVLKASAWGGLISIVVAYPIGWCIDRFGGLKMVIVFWCLQAVCWFWAMQIGAASDLVVMAILLALTGPFYAAADIMVYRQAPPADMGSVTATNSFVRNLYWGALGGGSGVLIAVIAGDKADALAGAYRWAFTIGMGMSTVGLALYLTHAFVMRRFQARTVS